MTRLCSYSTPAERDMGCSFAEIFESQADVEANNGVVNGAPVISNGITLDGAADYLTYSISSIDMESPGTVGFASICVFTPDFNWNEDAQRYLYDSTNGNRLFLYKDNNAGSNVIWVSVGAGGGGAFSIAATAYSMYWRQNEVNTIIVNCINNNQCVWLNGVCVYSAANSFTAYSPTEFYIGARFSGVSLFDGIIHFVQVYKGHFTDAEVLHLTNGTMYKYMDNITAHWQMRQEDHDPTNTRTLDSSGNGWHVSFGVNPPTKNSHHGYSFNGTNQRIEEVDASAVPDPDGSFSVAGCFRADLLNNSVDGIIGKGTSAGDDFTWGVYRYSDDLYFILVKEGGTYAGRSQLIKTNCLTVGNVVFFCATYQWLTDGTSIANLYVNDLAVASLANFQGPPNNSGDSLYIGSSIGGSNYWAGDILELMFFDGLVLTPMQVADIRHLLTQSINKV